jgi:prophage antirepressor-like protein
MEVVKAFNDNNLHTEIVIKGTYDEPLFRANDIGEILEMSNIRAHIQNFDKSEKVVNTIDTLGGSQQVTFLTEKGLYKILFKSRKPIAEKFQNWVCEVIKEIRVNGVYDLQKEIEKKNLELTQIEDVKNKEMEEKLIKQKESVLLSEYANSGSLVYIIKVKTFTNSEYIIKIGHSTKGIQNRYNEHKTKYDECLLINCFSVDKSRDFECFLHNHEKIRLNKITDLPGHEKENELFLVGKNLTYQIITKIINDNIKKYNYSIGELLKENELLKYQIQGNQTNINNELMTEFMQTIKTLSNKIDNLEKINKEILDKVNSTQSQTKTVTNFNIPVPTLGPRLQKIHPDTLQLMKVYETVSDAMKENKNIKRPSINKAIIDNTVYCGFRWLLVERNLDPNIITNIEPTKKTKIQNLGYIAKLNTEKNLILNVYLDRKTAAKLNGYDSISALDNHVKKNTIANGRYYQLYDECDEGLKNNFENINGVPLLYKNGLGQYDLEGNLVKEFSCKYDCIKNLSMSDKTLTKALDKNISYNGYYYKELGEKLAIL